MKNINWYRVYLWFVAVIAMLAVNTGVRLLIYHVFNVDALWINVVVSIFCGIILGILFTLIDEKHGW